MAEALSCNASGNDETRERLVEAAFEVQSLNATPEVKRKFFDTARREMPVQIDANRNDARYEFLFASFLNKF